MKGKYLPPEWKSAKLGNIAQMVMGQSPPSNTYNDNKNGLPFLQGKADFTESFPKPTKWSIMPLKIAPNGSVLISVRAPVGDVNLADQDYIIGRGISSISLKSGNNNFLFYSLLYNKTKIEAQSSGTTFRSINKAALENFDILLPPLPEQRAIARALRAVQDAREARQREIALERERKAALMEQLFTHGTRGEATKMTEIGEMPESWKIYPFEKLAEIIHGQVDPKIAPYKQMLHIGPDNIEMGTGRLLPAKTAEQLKLISGKYLFSSEHILYSKIRPYLRKVALAWFTGICSADMYPIKPRCKSLMRDFLFQFMLTEMFTSQAISFQDRTGIPKINREQLGRVSVPLPLFSEQQLIANSLDACDSNIAALDHEARLHDELFRAMLEELMSGRLKVDALEKQR